MAKWAENGQKIGRKKNTNTKYSFVSISYLLTISNDIKIITTSSIASATPYTKNYLVSTKTKKKTWFGDTH